MRAVPRRALGVGLVVLLGVSIVAGALGVRGASPPGEKRPVLLVLTSLPLLFGDDFSVRGNGSPALDALEEHYRVVPISTTAAPELAKGRLLLMAQPLGQAPEDLVALDAWVRRGGRVMLLADPLLDWPSKRPLGDPLRPPPTFVDTGLLGHWGLRLYGPDKAGTKRVPLRNRTVETSSPGLLVGKCPISAQGLVARCQVGKGAAIVIADADLLNVAALGAGAQQNLNAVMSELRALERE